MQNLLLDCVSEEEATNVQSQSTGFELQSEANVIATYVIFQVCMSILNIERRNHVT